MEPVVIFVEGIKVKNFPNYIAYKDGTVYSKYMKEFLKPSLSKDGYYVVTLYENGKGQRFRLHVLIALCFLPNPENKPIVNHKDLNKLNDHVDNLEWVTSQENAAHAMANGANKCRSTPVNQFDLEGNFIKHFGTVKAASEETGISQSCISSAINSKTRAFSGGFYWSKK